MNDYVIVTDSTADLSREFTSEMGIKIIPMKYLIGDKVYLDNGFNIESFYLTLRDKVLPSTTQINVQEFVDFFSKYLKNNQDILYIGFSSGLSGTYNSALLARDELLKLYPDRKIKVIDSASASVGQGLLVYNAALIKKNGGSIDEAEKWVNQNKLKCCHWFMVDDLFHLKRGGRISPTAAVMGSILSVKPVLCLDNLGKLSISKKARGRRKALDLIVSKLSSAAPAANLQTIFIGHGDVPEDANYVAEKIKSEFSVKNLIINHIGPVIGSHTGPGALALIFLGNHR